VKQASAKRLIKRWIRLLIRGVSAALGRVLPLPLRLRIVKWTGRRGLPGNFFVSMVLLSDFAASRPNEFHRFLWSHHLAYAKSYETSRFVAPKLEFSRVLLFREIQDHLRKRGLTPERDVQSVFDVGCSVGNVLRYAETQVFPAATRLRGVDVDRHAIDVGAAYLRDVSSKIELAACDATDLERAMGKQNYDLVLCCGVLLYFDQPTAADIVKTLLRHTRLALGLIGLAHPSMDNSILTCSVVRPRDHAFIHNLDAMIRNAGGRVICQRWMAHENKNINSPPYIVLAEPNGSLEQPNTTTEMECSKVVLG
jgi:SAM-dependent methyltransferase